MGEVGQKPLEGRHRIAAQLIGEGVHKKDVAAEVGVSARTISEWLRREDFCLLVRKARDNVLDEAPTARAVLESALTATTPRGHADWKSRIAAARALTGLDSGGVKPSAPKAGGKREIVFDLPDD